MSASDESLDFSERWLRDGLRILNPPHSVVQVTVDMTNALRRLEDYRRAGHHVSPTHLLVQAAARALAGNRQLHQLVAGTRRHFPERVDIGLSITGETFVAPGLVIEGADHKTPPEIAAEIVRRVPEAQAADQALRRALKQWGWLVPFGFLRRAVLRLLFSSAEFRRRGAGTFQVSVVPAEWACTSTFSTAGVLMAGQVRSQVVAVDGQPAVRPMMTMTLSGDHGVWDGRAAVRFMATVKADLESQPAG